MKTTRLVVTVLLVILVAITPVVGQEAVAELVQKVKPAVVTIITYDADGQEKGQGTGFFVDKSHVITSFHVIRGASKAEVKTVDGKTHAVKGLAASDEIADIARLALEKAVDGASVLTLAKETPKEGVRIVVVGNPLGLEHTVSDGIVSAVRDLPGMGKYIQLTAPISPGSSGSPVLNLKGEVVGVVAGSLSEGQSLNFAASAEHVEKLESKAVTALTEVASGRAHEHLTRALSFILNEEYEKAIPHLQAATKADPGDSETWFELGYCYGELGLYTEAIDAFKQAVRIDPDDQWAHHNLGTVYAQLGRYSEAIACYKQAIRINPDSAEAHSNLGRTYACIGQYPEAIGACKQAIRIDADDAYAHHALGLVYHMLGRYSEAIDALRQAIRLDPDDAHSHAGLGDLYLRTGDRSTALDQYRILKDLDTELANKLFDMIYP